MDILNLWKDDPEEVLLDLGFGCDEPDLSGRIPARFINHQSQARGMNLKVFLEAQKNRLDLENPDVSNRFRQLEVLQQVTTAFSSLVRSPFSAPLGKALPPEVQERRRRMGLLFRRASKKSLSQIQMHNHKTPDLSTAAAASSSSAAPEALQPPFSLGDKDIPSKKLRPGLLETVCLSPLAEETGQDPQAEPNVAPVIAQEGALRHWALTGGGHPLTPQTMLLRKKSPAQAGESFEIEEIHSFDESYVTGYTGGAEHLVQGVLRSNSCQSDSSGFLEEPFIPLLIKQASPGADLIKALSGLSGGTDSQSSERAESPPPPPPCTPATLSAVNKPLLVSPSLSPKPSLVFDSPPCPLSLCLPNSDQHNSEKETQSEQDQSLLPSLSTSVCEYSQELTMPSPSVLTEEKETPSSHSSALLHVSEGPACSPCPSAAHLASCPFPSPNLDRMFSLSTVTSCSQPASSSGSPGDPQSEQTGVALHRNSSSSQLHPSVPHDFHCPTTLKESLSQDTENHHKDSVLEDSDGISLSDPFTSSQKDGEETPSLSFQLEQDNVLASSSLILVSSEERCPKLPHLLPNPSFPVGPCALQSYLRDPEGLIDPAGAGIPDLLEQSICRHDNTIEPAPAPQAQDIIHVKMNHFFLDFEETNQRFGKGAAWDERHTDTVQTQKNVVYISDTESSAGLSEGCRVVSEEECNKTKIDPQLLSTGTQPEHCQGGGNGSENKSLSGSLILHNSVQETNRRAEVQPKDLIKIESLEEIFQTSVDSSDGDTGDVEAFFEQLDTEGRAYWAEPIQVSNPSPVLEESVSIDSSGGSHGNSQWPSGPALPDLLPSTRRAVLYTPSSSTTMCTDQISRNKTASSSVAPAPFSSPSFKTSSRSVSVQMSSSPSSHIVQRKDVPYITDSKRTLQSSFLSLDTSTPFRAVQSWTDLQIQRSPLTNNLSQWALHTSPQDETLCTSARETHDCYPEKTQHPHTTSLSVDKGLWLEEEEVDRNGYEEEGKHWREDRRAAMSCCCSCDHQCNCPTQKRDNIPFSLDELEEMMLCLQHFCSVLSDMEEQLSEDQAAVYGALSDPDREMVQDIEELRRAVKQEAGELEMQLNELADHYDDNLKRKMHRLLDEQSLLCSQLKVSLPGAGPTSSRPAPKWTAATQSCPLEERHGPPCAWRGWDVSPLHQSLAESKEDQLDMMDMMGVLQRVRTLFQE
ncbi:uncharacterized protein itprid1 [Pungitius pungitius]|uniref:uncharacterized protein itprid1 n=1 Tax=Pungitius pungitius TaxID=134920 RepID=UPI002E1587FD